MTDAHHTQIVENLLTAYAKAHPFTTTPEHTDERGLSTPSYYDALLTYNQALEQWVQQQAQHQGIDIHVYRLSTGRRESDTYYYDFYVDGVITLQNTHYQESYEYALHTMRDQDLYCEAAVQTPITGHDLRKGHNDIQAHLASDTTYRPQYSYGPGPFTSEIQENA